MDTGRLAERYLELLADDRPVTGLDADLEGVSDDTDRQQAQRLHDLAVRARSLRELGRRRETELRALYDTVADLSALKDLDDVLAAIVRRARSLLGCDVSYLSFNDHDAGYTYMRHTEGIHSEEFRRVRLGFGEGIGGLVAQTARPYLTADYFADDRFEHTTSVDSAVRSEGLTAILGVPLLLGRTVTGVLYAANHDARPFGREDVDLLSSFAGHAALALENARRTEATQRALADLQQTSELLRQAAEGSQRASDAHDRLAAVVLQGGSLQDVADELHDVLEEPVLIVDARGTTLAVGGAPPLFEEEEARVRRSLDDNRAHVEDGVSIAPVWAGGAPLAAVVVRTEVDDVSRRILERAASTAALLMVVQRSTSETETRLRGDLLVDLLLGRSGTGSLSARASVLGADLTRPLAVLVVEGADAQLRQACGDLAAGASGLLSEVGDRLVLVVADRDPVQTGRQLVGDRGAQAGPGPGRVAVGRPRPTVGAAGPVTGVDGVRDGYAEATRCLDALLSLGRRGDVADSATLGFVGLLLGKGDPREHVRDRLGPVLDYDAERGTALAHTLEVWLAQDRHLARTGEELHVHPNTVTQRLDRVGRLLGERWQEPERLLELGLALRLRRILAD